MNEGYQKHKLTSSSTKILRIQISRIPSTLSLKEKINFKVMSSD